MELQQTNLEMTTTKVDFTSEEVTLSSAVEIPRYLNYFLAIYLIIVGTIGGIGNSVVIFIFGKTKSLQTPGNMLIINLAVGDLIMVITQFPAMFVTTVAGQWLYGDIGCQIYAFFGSTFGVMSIASMSAISIDRYYAICKPMKTTRTISKRRSKRIIMAVWLYCLAWSVPPLFGFGSYSREGYGLSCTFDYVDQSFVNSIFVAMLFVTDFFLPLAIIIGCYTKIVFTVRAHNKEMKKVVDNKLEDTLKLKKLKNEKKEFKIAKIGMIMTSLFCIAWLPYASVSFIAQFFDPSIVNPFLQTMPVVCAKSSSVLNPIVYAITHEKFKTALTKRFLQNCCGSYEKEVAARERSQNIHQRAQFRRTAESSISAVVETSITTHVSEDPPPNPEENVGIPMTTGPVSLSSLKSDR